MPNEKLWRLHVATTNYDAWNRTNLIIITSKNLNQSNREDFSHFNVWAYSHFFQEKATFSIWGGKGILFAFLKKSRKTYYFACPKEEKGARVLNIGSLKFKVLELIDILTTKTGTDENLVAPIVLGEKAFLAVAVELL